MSKKRFANVWDAIENTPAQAENMKLRSALMMALKVQISFARFLRLLLETMQHVNCIIELRHIQHSECSGGIANPNFPHPFGRRRICMKKPE
jgi:predicted XRE-type DNA-binding protein